MQGGCCCPQIHQPHHLWLELARQATALNHHHHLATQTPGRQRLVSTDAPAPEPCDDTSPRRSGSRSLSNSEPTSDTP